MSPERCFRCDAWRSVYNRQMRGNMRRVIGGILGGVFIVGNSFCMELPKSSFSSTNYGSNAPALGNREAYRAGYSSLIPANTAEKVKKESMPISNGGQGKLPGMSKSEKYMIGGMLIGFTVPMVVGTLRRENKLETGLISIAGTFVGMAAAGLVYLVFDYDGARIF